MENRSYLKRDLRECVCPSMSFVLVSPGFGGGVCNVRTYVGGCECVCGACVLCARA